MIQPATQITAPTRLATRSLRIHPRSRPYSTEGQQATVEKRLEHPRTLPKHPTALIRLAPSTYAMVNSERNRFYPHLGTQFNDDIPSGYAMFPQPMVLQWR